MTDIAKISTVAIASVAKFVCQASPTVFGYTTPSAPTGDLKFYMKCNDGAYLVDAVTSNTADSGVYTGVSTGGAFNTGYLQRNDNYYLAVFQGSKFDQLKFDFASGFTIECFLNGGSVPSTDVEIYVASNNAAAPLTWFGFYPSGSNISANGDMIHPVGGEHYWWVDDIAVMPSSMTHAFMSFDGTYLYAGYDGTIIYKADATGCAPDFSSATEAARGIFLIMDGASSCDSSIDNVAIHSVCKWTGNVSDSYTPPSAEY